MNPAPASLPAHPSPRSAATAGAAPSKLEPLDATRMPRLPDGRATVAPQAGHATAAAPAATLPGARVHVPAEVFAAGTPPAPDSASPRPFAPPAQPGAVPALTPAARSVAALALRAGEVTIRDPLPLDDGGKGPSQAAARLRHAVETSGLFYEAHVAQWAQGARPAAALAREPQAALARPRSPTQRSESRPCATPQHTMRTRDPEADAGEAPRLAVVVHAEAEALAVPPAARELVAQQLALLADPCFVWRGQAWPGQPVTIEFAQERAAPDGQAAQPSWRLALTVELAALGRVEAEIRATGRRIAIGVGATRGAVELLAGTRSSLEDALAAAGVDAAVTIERDA
jgi:hypothetical protein